MGVLDLTSKITEKKNDFEISHIVDEEKLAVEPREHRSEGLSEETLKQTYEGASDVVKITFQNLVQLVQTRSSAEIFDKYPDENIVMSTNLLAELASAKEEKEDTRKASVLFCIGLIMGVIVTVILFTQ